MTINMDRVRANKPRRMKGDLVVWGDIEEGADLTVEDGNLTVKGCVGKNASITFVSKKHSSIQINNLNLAPGARFQCNFGAGKTKISTLSVGKQGMHMNGMRAVPKKQKFKIHIKGVIEDHVKIISRASADIKADSSIGNHVTIDTETGSIDLHSTGKHAYIKTNKSPISIGILGSESRVITSEEMISVNIAGRDSNITTTRADILVGHIESGTKLYTSHARINYGSKEENTQLLASNSEVRQDDSLIPQVLREQATCTVSSYNQVASMLTPVIDVSSASNSELENTESDANTINTTLAPVSVRTAVSTETTEVTTTSTHGYTAAMQNYIDSCKRKQAYSERLRVIMSAMNIASDTLDTAIKKFSITECPISQDIPEIPVRVDGNVFDLDSLLDNCPMDNKGMRKHPLNRDKFTLEQIQPARDQNEAIDKFLKSYEEKIAKQRPSIISLIETGDLYSLSEYFTELTEENAINKIIEIETGNTCLHYAAAHNKMNIVAMLVNEFDADVIMTNKNGDDVLTLLGINAEKSILKEIIERAAEKRLANISSTNIIKNPPDDFVCNANQAKLIMRPNSWFACIDKNNQRQAFHVAADGEETVYVMPAQNAAKNIELVIGNCSFEQAVYNITADNAHVEMIFSGPGAFKKVETLTI